MGQIKLQSPLFDKIFLTKLLFIAQLDTFKIILNNLMNFDNCDDLFDDFNQVLKKDFEQVQRNFGQMLGVLSNNSEISSKCRLFHK